MEYYVKNKEKIDYTEIKGYEQRKNEKEKEIEEIALIFYYRVWEAITGIDKKNKRKIREKKDKNEKK